MITGQVRERKKADKRVRILNAAELLIATKGYEIMTIDEIAKDAGIAKGTVYLYYRSKEALCAAVLVRIGRALNATYRERVSQAQGGLDKLKVFDDAGIEYSMDHPQYFRVLKNLSHIDFRDTADPNVLELVQIDEEQLQILVGCYEAAIREGSLRPDIDPVLTAIFMRLARWVAVNPVTLAGLTMDTRGISRQNLVNFADDMLMRSIRNNESGR